MGMPCLKPKESTLTLMPPGPTGCRTGSAAHCGAWPWIEEEVSSTKSAWSRTGCISTRSRRTASSTLRPLACRGWHTPGLLIAVDDGGVSASRKNSMRQLTTAGLQLLQGVDEHIRGLAGAHVIHQGHSVIPPAGGGAEPGELHHHLRREIVDDIVSDVLQKRGGLAFAAAGQAGYNENFHVISSFPGLFADTDLRLQPDARPGLVRPLLHLGGSAPHVGAGGAAGVDDEARVLFGYLGSAHRQALEAGLVDEGPGEVALRPLEGAAGAGPFQGLGGPCAGPSGHPSAAGWRRDRRGQAHHGPQHHGSVLQKPAVPVGKFCLVPGEAADAGGYRAVTSVTTWRISPP